MSLTLKKAEEVAARWNTSTRTVYRWFARGVNVSEPAEVIEAIISAKCPTIAMIEAATRETLALEKITSQSEPLP